jgi:hypothetical protein
MGDFLFVSNIGKNIEIQQWTDGAIAPIRRWLFDGTSYPGEDRNSLLDLDMHSVFCLPDDPHVLISNHFGTIRAFDFPPNGTGSETITPRLEMEWLGDVERWSIVGSCLITSAPRGHETSDTPQSGLRISESLADVIKSKRYQIGFRSDLEDWGVVTALAVDAGNRLLAIAVNNRVGLFRLFGGDLDRECDRDRDDIRLGDLLWQTELSFPASMIEIDPARQRVVAAGADVIVAESTFDAWDKVTGGQIASLSLEDGHLMNQVPLDVDIAWGYGCEPFYLDRSAGIIYGVDRYAGLHKFDSESFRSEQIYASMEGNDSSPDRNGDSPDPNRASLGIGHLTRIGGNLFAGFNRGGHRLFRYQVPG